MSKLHDGHHGPISRNEVGPGHAEAFILIAIATILITRLYLKLTGYPQVGGGNLHIAHTLYGELLMMLALVLGWLLLGAGSRNLAIVLGGIGFGLVLDEVGKFVTKDNDYFYGPSAEIMYVVVVVILLGTRALRAVRPLTVDECLASASLIAADGMARGLGGSRRDIGLRLVERAQRGGADSESAEHVRALLLSARPSSDRLHDLARFSRRLVPSFVRSPRVVLPVGWVIVIAALAGLVFHAVGVALGGYDFHGPLVTVHFPGMSVSTAILMVGEALTVAMALPATLALPRSDGIWPIRWLREAALLFTLLSALVHFATEGFEALINLSIGVIAMAILSFQLGQRERQEGREQTQTRANRGRK